MKKKFFSLPEIKQLGILLGVMQRAEKNLVEEKGDPTGGMEVSVIPQKNCLVLEIGINIFT